jgi:glutathione reductase (NADPH)
MLVYGAHFAEDLEEAQRFGWDIGSKEFVWPRLRDIIQTDIDRLEGLYGNTLNSHNVKLYEERATLSGPNSQRICRDIPCLWIRGNHRQPLRNHIAHI